MSHECPDNFVAFERKDIPQWGGPSDQFVCKWCIGRLKGREVTALVYAMTTKEQAIGYLDQIAANPNAMTLTVPSYVIEKFPVIK